MDTKETTLAKCYERFDDDENLEPFTNAELLANAEVLKAMDQHARNCMIEVLRWYMNDSFDQKHADKYVDRFLQSDTFKELQK